jgi:hypothetical protein
MCLNSHSQLATELIQASGRYRYSIYYSACALVTLAALFLIAKAAAGLLAIGWAWIGAALLAACVADALLLRISNGGKESQIAGIAGKVLATAACMAMVAGGWGMVGLVALPFLAWSAVAAVYG